LPLDEDDVALVFEDLYMGRSILPPHNVLSRPALTRWDPAAPLSSANLVVMELADADTHARECFGVQLPVAARRAQFVDAGDETPDQEAIPPFARRTPAELWGQEVQELFERRARDVEKWSKVVVGSG
jgi:hypothetical protein